MATAPLISADRMQAAQLAMDHMRGADSAIEAKNQEKIRRLDQQMAKMPWRPASFVSLHAFLLTSSSQLTNELRISPAPLATDERFPHIVLPSGRKLGYTQHVFSTYSRNLVPNDAGEIEAYAVLPIDVALGFMGQYYSTRPGGIFCYEGTEAPERMPLDTLVYVDADRSSQTRGVSMPLMQAIEFAHDIQVKHYLREKGEADEAWNGTDAKKRDVIGRSNVIKMTRMLRAWGELSEDPAWLKSPIKRSTSEPVVCKSCGHESKPGALVCVNGKCTYVFHPFKAFSELVIDLNREGAGLALRRLQPNQVNQLIRWGRFTQEEAEAVGYKFGKGKKAVEAGEQPDPSDEDDKTGEPKS
jgi:hypothetical protein